MESVEVRGRGTAVGSRPVILPCCSVPDFFV